MNRKQIKPVEVSEEIKAIKQIMYRYNDLSRTEQNTLRCLAARRYTTLRKSLNQGHSK